MRKLFFCALFLIVTSACDQQPPQGDPPSPVTPAAKAVVPVDSSIDYFTYANTDQFQTRHLELDLDVDFQARQIRGLATLSMRRVGGDSLQIILDSRGLIINSADLIAADGQIVALEFQFGESDPVRGTPLKLQLPDGFLAEDDFQIRIDYHTGADASAIMWLPPELTAGGKQPFMFTQSQSIHARSWVPLQDSPSIRFTYDAIIRTPPDLLALMSANNDPLAERDGSYEFSMPQPIPSYLLALAVGNVFFESFGEDTGVYAEPEILPAAAYEFADTQSMLDAAEAIYGPYQWGRYDLLILPPSFPFGGMENPRLSFITPTVLAGDRSLVSLIAHELAHSWSGNLVSNATWRDIWLNEGTTSYLESRLMEVLYGKERADEERLLSYQALLETLQDLDPEMQGLAPVFENGDPDVGQEGLEYSKGQLLLDSMENLFGRETFDAYMAGYFQEFSFQAIGSEQFLDYIDESLLKKHPGVFTREQLEVWLYEPGIPATAVIPQSSNLDAAEIIAAQWSSGERAANEIPYSEWSPQAVVYFIKALPAELSEDQLLELDQEIGLSRSRNAEITRAWFMQVAARKHHPAYGEMSSYLGRYGRTRLVAPVYAALIGNGEDGDLAREIFTRSRSAYHPMTVSAIEREFGGASAD
jgi:leukotriene-A4 hydrolase